jgi:PAS domain S-box-containing protein
MNTPHELKILMLEDQAADAELALRELRKEGLQVAAKRVMTQPEFEAELQNPALDLILSDFKLPAYDGISALMAARRQRPDVPFIMVSGSMGEEIAIDTMRLGATDYVLKQRLHRLGAAVTRALKESGLTKNQARAESLIRHLHEVLRAVRDVDELIVREREPEKIFAEACRILVRTRGCRLVWIGLATPDQKRVTHAASAGPAAGCVGEINGAWDEAECGQCAVSVALRKRQTRVVQNIATDAGFVRCREAALAQGCGSMAAVPMVCGERLFGLINVYADRPDAFDKEELHLLKELADDLAFALQNIEAEQQHRRAEAALRDSEASLRRAQAVAHIGSWHLDVPTGRLTWSDETYRIFGLPPGTPMTLEGFLQRVHPDDRELVNRNWNATLRGQRYDIEHRIVVRGVEKWVCEKAELEFDAQGSPLRGVGTVQDITESKRAEETQNRLMTAIEQAAETIVVTDANGAIQYANPAFERSSGYTRQEALGQNPRILKSGKQDAAFYQRMWETLARGEVWHGHFLNKRKDGALYEEEATITPVRDQSGRIVNYVAIKLDVTHRKALEAQLRESQKMEAIGTLAGGVAHEINNPINGIMNYAQLVADKLPADSRLQQHLAGILKETHRVSQIVRNLLSFARQDKTGRSPANLNDIVNSALTLIQTVIRHDQITLELDVPPDLPQMECRSQQLEQVLMNLLTNARDALNEKYPAYDEDKIIRVSVRRFGQDGAPWLRTTVEDHGNGIPAEIAGRVFDPFYTTKPAGKGTGLGLSISYGIIEEHGGRLHFETEPGCGTRFHMDLPVR